MDPHDLQVFLGMMVYFSVYILFHAWIAGPYLTFSRVVWSGNGPKYTLKPLNSVSRFWLMHQFVDMQNLGLHIDYIQTLVILDQPSSQNKSKGFNSRTLKEQSLWALWKGFDARQRIPSVVVQITKLDNDVPKNGSWAKTLDETWVYIDRVITYWSRVLKPVEQNYSPTEREAFAKRRPRQIPTVCGRQCNISCHQPCSLSWRKTFQNVNRRLPTWGTVFAAYTKLQIFYHAGWVHSNVNPISRLRRRVPHQQGPTVDATQHISLDINDNPLRDMYSKIGEKFKEKLLNAASKYINSHYNLPDYSHLI